MLRHGVTTGITYNLIFDEYEACVAAGLDLWKWTNNVEYSKSFKASVVAWYRMHKLVETHTQSAIADKVNK